jgi:type IV secretory pathway protease TraF
MSLPGSGSAPVDSSGRPLPHSAWGRHVLAGNELWLMSTRVPNSWDSRYLGPFSTSQIRAVARPMWTIDAPIAGAQSAELSQ